MSVVDMIPATDLDEEAVASAKASLAAKIAAQQQDGSDAQLARSVHLLKVSEVLEERGHFTDRVQQLCAFGLVRVSEDDYAAWCRFLPSSYWLRENSRPYLFDIPPSVVLRRIAHVHGIADAIEIRTPEPNLPDPVAFAFVYPPAGRGRVIFLVARWAESSASLIDSIADVRKVLAVRRGLRLWPISQVERGQWPPFIATSIGAALLFAPYGHHIVPEDMVKFVVWSVPLFWVSLYGINYVSCWWRLWRLKKTNPKLARLV